MKTLRWLCLAWLIGGMAVAAGAQGYQPAPWKAGQFLELGSMADGQVESKLRLLVVAEREGGWVLEMRRMAKDGQTTLLQYLILGIDEAMRTGDGAKASVGWMKMRQGSGKVRSLTAAQTAMFGAVARSGIEAVVIRPTEVKDGVTVTVPAGSFPGSKELKSTTSVMGRESQVTSWVNPKVPVNGLVKSVSADGKTELQLLAYGTDGRPELPLE